MTGQDKQLWTEGFVYILMSICWFAVIIAGVLNS